MFEIGIHDPYLSRVEFRKNLKHKSLKRMPKCIIITVEYSPSE